jgi:hypothetical protein
MAAAKKIVRFMGDLRDNRRCANPRLLAAVPRAA